MRGRVPTISFALAALLISAGCHSNGGYGTGSQAAQPSSPAPTATRSYATAPAPAPRPAQSTPGAAPATGSTMVSQPATSQGAIPFDATDLPLDQALAAAQRAGKPAALYVLSRTCGYCTKLLSGTLTNPGVQAQMGNFYNVRYEAHSPAGSAVATRYARGGFPTTVVVDGSGNVIKEIVGYEDPQRYAGNLAAAHR